MPNDTTEDAQRQGLGQPEQSGRPGLFVLPAAQQYEIDLEICKMVDAERRMSARKVYHEARISRVLGYGSRRQMMEHRAACSSGDAEAASKAAPAAGLVRGRISRRDGSKLEEWERHGWKTVATVYPGGVEISHPADYQGKVKKGAGGTRGEVKGFSAASRRGLMGRLIRFPWQEYCAGKRAAFAKAAFVTLTYPDRFPGAGTGTIDRDKIKRDIDTLRKRLGRLKNFLGLLWRVEVEPRKSGTHAGEECPHFHCLLVFRQSRPVAALRRWIAGSWFEIVGSLDERHRKAGTRVDSIYNPGAGKLMQYLGKYIAKVGEHQPVGRLWGIIGEFPQAEGERLEAYSFTTWEFAVEKLKRWGKKSRYMKRYKPWWGGLTLYGEPAEFLKVLGGLFKKSPPRIYDDFRQMFDRNRQPEAEILKNVNLIP